MFSSVQSLWHCVVLGGGANWTMTGAFLDAYEPDFKVAWFDRLFGGFCSILLYFIVFIAQPEALWGEGKIQWLPNCCELKENVIIIMILLFIYVFIFFCTSWNGLNFALLASIVYWHKVHPFDLRKFMTVIMTLIIRECTSKQDEKKKEKRKVQQILFLFFINLRNNILHEYKYNGRYFGLYKKVTQFEEKKKNVPFLLYLYISKYLLKYVILLILLTIKGFLNKNLFTCFWTLSRLLELDLLLSVTRLKDLCNQRKSIKNCK